MTTYDVEEADEPLPTGGYRTYEVYQRERVGETTNLINPRDLISRDYLVDPFPFVDVLRENYPCFRDWVGNRFWVTRYDDVTSIFSDDANFESRSRAASYAGAIGGSDLAGEPTLDAAWANAADAHTDAVVEQICDDLGQAETADLALQVAARLRVEMLGRQLGVDEATSRTVAALLWRMHRGAGWNERDRVDGAAAHHEMAQLLGDHLSRQPGSDAVTVVGAAVEIGATGQDLATTLLERDHETLHGSLANLWCLLLTNPGQLAAVRAEPRLAKYAYLEALRHSPPVLAARRYARHEVERFGRLLPDGALLYLSAAAANRDPRQFGEPAQFVVERKDLCQREPRGQFRADGLPAGIAFGHGRPSRLPAVPREAPRSNYALTRDVAVRMSQELLERFPAMRLVDGADPSMRSLRLDDTYTCWSLPVRL